MNAPLRHPASPYARRLARQRGIALDGLAGSGPFGRIVAADIEAFIPRAATETRSAIQPAPSTAALLVAVAALGTRIKLQALRDLITQFAGAKLELSFDALLSRSIGRSLQEISPHTAVAWEIGSGSRRRLVGLPDVDNAPFSRIQRLIESDSATATVFAVAPVSLSIFRLLPQGIRPLMLSLLPDFSMRLAISVEEEEADALLYFDSRRIDENAAANLLSQIRENLEAPLRLLA
jgi:pyruvate/2-oxoglutarate dehydrogenase complex dihydrolipoamide acyltransferase (E2) component